ncbi:MAG: hypothetical protein ACXWVM_43130, partial [Polyangiales bacterium]
MKISFRSFSALSLFALAVGCGQQAPAPAPEHTGFTSQGLSTGLVISGVYGGGGGTTGTPTYDSDYVEIFNRG